MMWLASILLFVVVAAQVGGLVTFAGVRQVALTEGREISPQTAPVDPRSLFQADYAILDYEIAARPEPGGSSSRQRNLCGAAGMWRCVVRRLARFGRPAPSEVFTRSVVNQRGRLEFGIDTYFVPEGTGQSLRTPGMSRS